MITKLYYDDPLQAAYMAREFGVKYQSEYKWQSEKWGDKYGDYLEHFIFVLPGGSLTEQVDEYYIHPDSLDIFEPKLHDVVEWDGIMFGMVIGVNEEEGDIGVQHGCQDDGSCDVYTLEPYEITIIQRDNKPFFTPRREDV